MPTYALYWRADEVELAVTAGGYANVSSSAYTYEWGGSLTSYHRNMVGIYELGIYLESINQFDHTTGLYNSRVAFEIPALGYSHSHTQEGANREAKLLFKEWELYVVDGIQWALRFKSAQFFAGGSAIYVTNVLGENLLDNTGVFTPDGRPLIGLPPVAIAHYGNTLLPAPVLPVSHCASPSVEWDIYPQVNTRWRCKIGDSWYVGPVKFPSMSLLPGVCGDDDYATDPPSGEDTSSVTVSARTVYQVNRDNEVLGHVCDPPDGCIAIVDQVIDYWDGEAVFTSAGTSAWLFWDQPKGVVRLNPHDNYGALIQRRGLPKSDLVQTSSSSLSPPPEFLSGLVTNTQTTTLYPRQSKILSYVTRDTHPIEDTFGYETLSPARRSVSYHRATGKCVEIVTPGVYACPPGPTPPVNCGVVASLDYCYWAAASLFGVYTDTADMCDMDGWYGTPDPSFGGEGRLFNSWANPLWSYRYWGPQDRDEEAPIATDEWTVFNDRANFSIYWGPLRTQYIRHPVLPPGELKLTRNSVVMSPFFHGALSAFCFYLLDGQWLNFWGVSRGKTQLWERSAPHTYNQVSDALFTPIDATGSWQAGKYVIQADPGETEFALEIALTTFGAPPYMLAQICNSIAIDWTNSQVQTSRVFLVSHENEQTPIWDAQGTPSTPNSEPPGRLYYPKSEQLGYPAVNTHWAGSWQNDYSQLLPIGDAGFDNVAVPGGVSMDTFLDPERVNTFGLGSGWEWAKLRIEFEMAAPSQTLVFDEITIHPTDREVTAIPEGGHYQVLVAPESPGVRFGNWMWFNGASLQATPLIVPPGYPSYGGHFPSMLDALCFKRALWKGLPYNVELQDEIDTLFNVREGRTHLRADTLTSAVFRPVNKKWISGGQETTGVGVMLIDSYKEAPPIGDNFHFDIDPETWVPNGVMTNKAFAYDLDRRLIISAAAAVHMVRPGTNQVITQLSDHYADLRSWWKVTEHQIQLDNSEPVYPIVSSGVHRGWGRPWHCYFAIVPPGDVHRLHTFPHPTGLVYTVRADGEARKVWLDRWDPLNPKVPLRDENGQIVVDAFGATVYVSRRDDSRIIVEHNP